MQNRERLYYPFKKYVEYIFSPGCLSVLSSDSDWLPGPLQVLFEIVWNSLKQSIQTIINLREDIHFRLFCFDPVCLDTNCCKFTTQLLLWSFKQGLKRHHAWTANWKKKTFWFYILFERIIMKNLTYCIIIFCMLMFIYVTRMLEEISGKCFQPS